MIFQFEIVFVIWGVCIFIAIFLLIFLLSGLRVSMEYERLVIFRLGKYKRTIGPGVVWIMPWLEISRKIDLRIKTQDIPAQQIITRDNIPVSVESVVYFKVIRPEDAIIKIENFHFAVRQFTQSALRDVVGGIELDSVLVQRDDIATQIKEIVDQETENWGVDIINIKIQEIGMPSEMKRAMAAQAEAEREKRANIITAQGELEAAKNLQAAARLLAEESGALHLRTLQTIRDISHDPSQKIVIFLPGTGKLGDLIKQL